MIRVLSTSVLILMVILVSISCENDPLPPVDEGLDFFPLEVGMESRFRLDSIIYDDSENKVYYRSHILTEKVVDTFRDQTNVLIYRIEQSVSDTNDQGSHFARNVWESIDGNEAIRQEFSLKYNKLEFPVSIDQQWPGNKYVDPSTVIIVAGESIELFKFWPENYTLIFRQAETIEGIQYQDVITILQADEDSKIERRYSLEKYAKDFGLVYREMQILDTQCGDYPDFEECMIVAWDLKAERGFILRQWRIE